MSGENGGGNGFGGGGGAAGAATGFTGSYSVGGGAGGFGAGAGGAGSTSNGGGGLGAGGDVFVQQGGSLLIEGGSLGAGTVTGGPGGVNPESAAQNGTAGDAYGSAIFLQGNQAVTLSAASGQTLTVAGVIADETGSGGGTTFPGVGTLVLGTGTETGTVTLTGAETYVGPTLIEDGTLQLGTGGAGGSISTASSVTDDGTLAVDQSGTVTLSNAIAGTGVLVQEGSGTTVLTGANTYLSGSTPGSSTQVETGTLQVGNGGTTGSIGTGGVDVSGGTLAVDQSGTVTLSNANQGGGVLLQDGSGTTVLTAAETLAGTASVTAGTLQIGAGGTAGSLADVAAIVDDATLAVDESGAVTLSAPISGTGALLQAGSGTTVLTGTDTLTGQASITAGTLQIGSGGTAGSLAQVGLIDDAATLAVDESGTTTLAAAIRGSGALLQEGSGTTVLTRSAVGITDAVTIAEGTLQLGIGRNGDLQLDSSSIIDDSTLAIDQGSGLSTLSSVISGTGALLQEGGGTTVLTAADTYTGATSITAGTLELGNGPDGVGAGSVADSSGITDDATLLVDEGGTTTLAVAVSGTGTLVQAGGTLVLAAAESLTGSIVVASSTSTLVLGAGASVTQASSIADGGHLAVDEGGLVDLGLVTGAGTLLQEGSGTTVLLANDTFSGATTISAGVLQLGNGGAIGSLADSTIVDGGVLAVDESGQVTLAQRISGSGGVEQAGTGTTTLTGTNTYTGTTLIEAGTLELGNAAAAGSGSISFEYGGSATLRLDTTTLPANTITGFARGDTIDLAAAPFDGLGTAILAPGNLLVVTEGGVVETLQLDPTQSFAGEQFVLSAAAVGTDVTLQQVPCFCRGTRIRTARGEVAVEDLAVGDLVPTVLDGAGQPRPVLWLGHRRIDLARHPRPEALRPVRIRAGALGEGVPVRDLLVSPGHRLMLEGRLVCAGDLVNGATVAQEAPEAVEYWHVELDAHDVLWAEGAAAESYHDTGNRACFANGSAAGTVTLLHPVLDGEAAEPCLPYGEAGVALRGRLARRAKALGWRLERDPRPWLEAGDVRVAGVRRHGRHRFALPAGCAQVVLRSRVARPCNTSPGLQDGRRLGLLLHRLALQGAEGGWREVALDDARLVAGLHAPEDAAGWLVRWTDGAAVVPIAALGEALGIGAATALEVAADEDLLFWGEPALAAGEDVQEERRRA